MNSRDLGKDQSRDQAWAVRYFPSRPFWASQIDAGYRGHKDRTPSSLTAARSTEAKRSSSVTLAKLEMSAFLRSVVVSPTMIGRKVWMPESAEARWSWIVKPG